jgi:hypothetical protein
LLDPAFRRPDEVFAMSGDERKSRVKESDDLCMLRGPSPDDPCRYFVRCVLPVKVLDVEETVAWGLWAEVHEQDFGIILDRWSDPAQSSLPPMDARLANRIAGYPDTLSLPSTVQLTGPTSRPRLSLPKDSIHPFALECMAGVCIHRVMEWLAGMTR